MADLTMRDDLVRRRDFSELFYREWKYHSRNGVDPGLYGLSLANEILRYAPAAKGEDNGRSKEKT